MKLVMRLIFVACLSAVFAAASSAGPAGSGIDRREAWQQLRIRQGIRRGQLTRAEVWRLRAGQRHIRGMERRARADGCIGPRERLRLHRALDRESRTIWRLKHNGRRC